VSIAAPTEPVWFAPSMALPIDSALPEILARFRSHERLVLVAEPGAGKTTRLPAALLEAGLAGEGEILVLEPRRLAARSAAAYVAAQLGEPVGRRCGYRVRFEAAVSRETRLCFQTEGLLARRLRDDPDLAGVSIVLLDEFHERHVVTDLNLGLLRLAQARRRAAGRPLRLALLSATLDAEAVAARLEAPLVRVPGRAHPVAIEHLDADALRPRRGEREAPRLEALVARALRRLLREGLDGHVLVLLPGVAEIRRAAAACEELAREAGLFVLPLHGELPAAEQDRALAPTGAGANAPRKLVLATNVAETSITIDGVVAVIDSGLARVPGHDPFSGLPRLRVAKVSRASATQRAGRAGRTGPGRCLRLYTEEDHDARPERDLPELLRLELSEALLELHGAGVADPRAFPWLDPPPDAAIEAAETLLRRLGALEPGAVATLSEIGRAMLRLPLHPRLARLVVETGRAGAGELGAAAAALLGERRVRRGPGPERRASADLLLELEDLDAVSRHAATPASLGLDPAACRRVARARAQIERLLERPAPGRGTKPRALDSDAADVLLRRALLVAFPDRVARARDTASGERGLALAGGGSAMLARESAVQGAEWLLALDAEERQGSGGSRVLVRSAAAIEPEWLLELFPERIEERQGIDFDPVRERVDARSALRFEGLVLAESALRPLPPEASERLREAALAAGPEAFAEPGALATLAARSAFARGIDPSLPALDAARARTVLAALCAGRTSFVELREAGLVAAIESGLEGSARARLERLAPREVALPGRRRVAVRYEENKPPWVESRLQDFFGAREGPRIGDGRVPLVLHLLAPNRRAVQVTTDLAGFWERHYPALRRQLERRYPRHAWPEDPVRAPAR